MTSVSGVQHEFYQNLPDVDVGERAKNHKKPNPNAVVHTTVSLHRYPFFVASTSPLSSSSIFVASDPRQYAPAVHPLIHQRLSTHVSRFNCIVSVALTWRFIDNSDRRLSLFLLWFQEFYALRSIATRYTWI